MCMKAYHGPAGRQARCAERARRWRSPATVGPSRAAGRRSVDGNLTAIIGRQGARLTARRVTRTAGAGATSEVVVRRSTDSSARAAGSHLGSAIVGRVTRVVRSAAGHQRCAEGGAAECHDGQTAEALARNRHDLGAMSLDRGAAKGTTRLANANVAMASGTGHEGNVHGRLWWMEVGVSVESGSTTRRNSAMSKGLPGAAATR